MDKTKQIWYRFANDREQLNIDCVDALSKCYLMLGQKPDTEQIVMMSKLLVDDLSRFYPSMEMAEVMFAFEQGIRHSDSGGFVNVLQGQVTKIGQSTSIICGTAVHAIYSRHGFFNRKFAEPVGDLAQ